jgi:DNA-binding response OmpR family regulator
MPALYLAIPDPALEGALAEQAKTAGYGVAQNRTDDGIEAWIVDQAALSKDFAKTVREAMAVKKLPLLMLGDHPCDFELELITESFAKPLRLGHLLARLEFHIQAALRTRKSAPVFGPYRLEAQNRQVILVESGQVIRLTEKEVALLDYLVQAEAPVSRDELLAAIWGYARDIDTHTLETHIYQLRRKLDPDEKGLIILRNEQGLYRLDT